MNEKQRSNLIERYVSGVMTPTQERNFRRLLDSDRELRRMFDLEHAMVRGMRLDRDAIPREHGHSRAHVLSVLATVPAARHAARGTAETSAGAGGFAIGGGMKLLLGVFVAGVLILGTYLALPLFDRQQHVRPGAPPVGAAPAVAQPRQPGASAHSVEGSANVSAPGTTTSRTNVERPVLPPTSVQPRGVASPAPRRPIVTASPASGRANNESEIDTALPTESESRPPMVFAPDSVRMKVHIDAPK